MEQGIPKNDCEMIAMYGDYIAHQIAKVNRRKENFRDIYQSVVLRLIEGQIVRKFHDRVRSSRPDALTTEEVCLHLGISVDSWCDAQALYTSGDRTIPWMPTPLAGDADGLDALWATEEVERYEPMVSEYHERVAKSEGLIPKFTGGTFRTYLQTCVHNAWANWCRTHSRRHKDRVIDLFVRLPSDQVEGARENSELFDLVTDSSASTRRLTARIEVQHTIEQLQLGETENDFCALLSEGYTAVEAGRKLGYSRAVMYRIQRVLQG